MFSDEVTDPVARQWAIAQRLGYNYPAGMTPEEAKRTGAINEAAFNDIKLHLPDPVSTTDLINYHVVSPTLDVVGQPIVAGLTAVRNIAAVIVGGFVIIGGLVFVMGMRKK